jgi:hypothetical protein
MLPGALVLCAMAASGLELTWSAPPPCPQRDEVEEEVARLLGAGEPRSTPLAVEAVVRRTHTGWAVELRTPDGAHRALRGSTCQAVTRAAEVVFALMIDPLAPILPAAEPADPANTPDPAEAADTTSTGDTPPPEWSLGVLLLGDSHALPRPSPGVGLGGSVALAAGFHLEVQVLAFLPQTHPVDATGGAGATVGLFAGALGVRRDFTLGPWSLAPVLAWEAGAQSGRSFGVSDPAANAGFWLAARAGAMVGWTAERVRLGVRLEAAMPVLRPRFVVEGLGELHTASPVAARAALTVELRFPSREAGGDGH